MQAVEVHRDAFNAATNRKMATNSAQFDFLDGRWRLSKPVAEWFTARGWVPRAHQLEMLEAAAEGASALLIAPTGAGKTLAGFLPSLEALIAEPRAGLHTLYLSPLKALAVDVARNLMDPITEMGLPISVETRTGDTPAHRKQRQRHNPPNILMTTPEQLALMISHRDAARLFSPLRRLVLDELHSLVISKRGDLMALGLARLKRLAPSLTTSALSATVARPDLIAEWIGTTTGSDKVRLIETGGGAAPAVDILASADRVPWAGHSAAYAIPELYEIVKRHRTSLLFVNTRSQAEMLFQMLWDANEDGLAIALHHGSLSVAQRRKVEAAMAAGRLRAVVATSTLDLGIDWGDVDLVIQIGAPKGASRLIQRIGRANHRLEEPSKALLVPANRFEVLECEAAQAAVGEGVQDSPDPIEGGLDVLAQHVLGMACAGPFEPGELYDEITSAWPYRNLPRELFDRVVEFVATGGYALRSYEHYARLRRTDEGRWRIAHPGVARQYRLNVGTIIEEPMVKVRLVRGRGHKHGATTGPIGRGGRVLGEMEEYFFTTLMPGDTFLFGGEIVAFEALRDNEAYVSRASASNPKIPSYMGGKFPLSTYLAERVRETLAHPAEWRRLPAQVREWLELQRAFSSLPGTESLLIETFPHTDQHYLVCYPFEGRLAHQTLGMLLTRRLERAGSRPLGFVASEYALAVWCASDLNSMIARDRLSLDALFDEDMLGDDLESWLLESSLMRRTFRNCAIIAGLIQRRHPGLEKTGRQITVSSDLIYDVLYEHEPDHVLIQATRRDAARGLLDIERLGACLKRIRRHIVHRPLDRISPLAVPVMLEIGKEPVFGEGRESVLAEAAEAMLNEAAGNP